jgi:hypothetical protein
MERVLRYRLRKGSILRPAHENDGVLLAWGVRLLGPGGRANV